MYLGSNLPHIYQPYGLCAFGIFALTLMNRVIIEHKLA